MERGERLEEVMHFRVATGHSLMPAYLSLADVLSQVVSAASKLPPKPLISIVLLFLPQLA
jgi:hypothetical protein